MYGLQSGFRKRPSTETALIRLLDQILFDIKCNNVTGLVCIDYSKAFDLINHDFLLVKLKAYGVDDGHLQLFRSYLADRQQSVNMNGFTSSPLGITHGVPQGSILGPLLFLTFINDLPLVISNSTVDVYADDTTFPSSAHCTLGTTVVETNLQEDIDRLCAWSAQNRMVLNAR